VSADEDKPPQSVGLQRERPARRPYRRSRRIPRTRPSGPRSAPRRGRAVRPGSRGTSSRTALASHRAPLGRGCRPAESRWSAHSASCQSFLRSAGASRPRTQPRIRRRTFTQANRPATRANIDPNSACQNCGLPPRQSCSAPGAHPAPACLTSGRRRKHTWAPHSHPVQGSRAAPSEAGGLVTRLFPGAPTARRVPASVRAMWRSCTRRRWSRRSRAAAPAGDRAGPGRGPV
jgi:hypothetical protein